MTLLKKKHCFILLEVLISLILVSTFAIFFIGEPIRGYEKEIESLKRSEYERIADYSFSQIQTDLYQHKTSFISLKSEEGKERSLDDYEFTFKDPIKNKDMKLTRSYKISFIKDKKPTDLAVFYYLLKIEIFITPKNYLPSSLKKKESQKKRLTYTYMLLVKKNLHS